MQSIKYEYKLIMKYMSDTAEYVMLIQKKL